MQATELEVAGKIPPGVAEEAEVVGAAESIGYGARTGGVGGSRDHHKVIVGRVAGKPLRASFGNLGMSDDHRPETELLKAAYSAFNARNIDAALATMTPDVCWPKAFKGGFVRGHEAVRAYWKEQWSEIDPHVEPVSFHREGDGRVLVDVHLVVRDLAGTVLADVHVGHRFTLSNGLVQAMEICPIPAFGHRT